VIDLAPARFSDKALAAITNSTARINIAEGSVRSSKTTSFLLRWATYLESGECPPGKLMLGGKTKDTVRRNLIDPLADILGSKAVRPVGNDAIILGRRHHIIGGNDEGAELRVRGLTLAGALIDEMTTVPESYVRMVLRGMSVPGAKLFGTTNPDSPNHWLKKGFLDRAAELNLAHFHFTLDDNPHLDPAFIAALKAEYVPGSLWYQRFIEGLWVMAQGAIYPMFDDSLHVVSVLPDPKHVVSAWVSIDYGTAHPFVALLFLHVSHPTVGDVVMVASEFRWESEAMRTTLTNPQYSQRLAAWLASPQCARYVGNTEALPSGDLARLYVDPSALSFSTQLHRDGFAHVNNADNEVVDGIRDVASLLGARKLLIHESCLGIRKEMPGYVWDDKAQARGEDKPVKKDDDSLDALRYGVRSRRSVWRSWPLVASKQLIA
jgi:PBSX family phage terminase large subunit